MATHRVQRAPRAAAWLALGWALAGCGNLVDASGAPYLRAIGPEGGSVALGGASAEVPEGALEATVTLEVRAALDAPAGHVGPPFEFLPMGLTFAHPATVRLPFDPAALPEGVEAADLRLATVLHGAWQEVPDAQVDPAAGLVTAQVSHFSIFAVWLPCDAQGPCFPGAWVEGLGCVYQARDCDDGDHCTEDQCAPATGQCLHHDREGCPPQGTLEASPAKLDFDAVLVGSCRELSLELKEVAGDALLIEDLRVDPACAPLFRLKSVPPLPYELAAKGALTIGVEYCPQASAATDCALTVEGDTGSTVVALSGSGILCCPGCPQAVIQVVEGDHVVPQTVLHLRGDQSSSALGALVKYEWSVEQPDGSTSPLIPSSSYPNPSLEANVAGRYVFHLAVTDDQGNRSCNDPAYLVAVRSEDAIHVELTWTTAGDLDPQDQGPGAGSDLDLHFARAGADSGHDWDGDGVNDPWFDPLGDVFWMYALQNWGQPASGLDDPHLDLDDVDGWGPENLSLEAPAEPGFHVGVHYWDDLGFGPSEATVRVYVYGVLIYQSQPVTLVKGDLWWACDLKWPSGLVARKATATGEDWLTHDYPRPGEY